MSASFVITNARLLDPQKGEIFPGAVRIKAGKIDKLGLVEMAEHAEPGVQVIDVGGLMLAPALIDLNATAGEPGAEHKESLASLGEAAAAGGVGTALVSPDTEPVIDSADKVDFLLRRGRDTSPIHLLATGSLRKDHQDDQLAEIGLMAQAGACLFSDSGRPYRSSSHLLNALEYCAGLGLPVSLRPCDTDLAGQGVVHESEFSMNAGLPAIPVEAEILGLMCDLCLAQRSAVRLVIDQISSRRAVEICRRAKEDGQEIFVTVSAHHLYLNELDVGDYRTFAKLSPPLRSEEDRQALLQAVQSGVIDAVVSGHSPQPAEDKRLPFEVAEFGASGIETMLMILTSLDQQGELPLSRSLPKATYAPAQLLGLAQGRLAESAPADLILFDPSAPLHFDAEHMRSKSKNSPLDGRQLFGKVTQCLLAGNTIYAKDKDSFE